MLHKMSITAMITEDEYNTLVADGNWTYQGNTLVNRCWKKEGVDSVAISRISKGNGEGDGFLYRQLSITFVDEKEFPISLCKQFCMDLESMREQIR